LRKMFLRHYLSMFLRHYLSSLLVVGLHETGLLEATLLV